MSLVKIAFAAGVIKDESPLAAEGGWIDADKVRFRQGMPETIGGWEIASTDQFEGIARGGHTWTDLFGQGHLAFGTADRLYAYSGGELRDITPLHSEGTLTNPFSTTNGSPTVTVIHAEHGFVAGQVVSYANSTPVGGITVNGPYEIKRILGRGRYEIEAASNATSTVADGGGVVDYTAPFPAGLIDGTGGVGYGTGAYSVGPYSLPSNTEFRPAVWSLDHFGETLLAVRRGGALYQWQPNSAGIELITQGDFSSVGRWARGTGWAITGGQARKTSGTSSNLSQNVEGVMDAGKTYRVTFDFTRTSTSGQIKFRMNAGRDVAAVIDVGTASSPVTVNGSYSRLFIAPADPRDIVFEADQNFAGTIDNVSVRPADKAYRIDAAPHRIDSMFVDPNRIIVLLGTEEADGDYNPALVRWSGQENPRVWLPADDNLAGELPVAKGGRLVAGLASRQQNLLWSDDALYSMQFTGDPTTVFSIQLLGTGCGAIGRHAVAEHNGIAFWWSNSGNPYIFQGAIPQVIECRLRRDVSDNIAPSQEEKMYAGINGEFSEVWFFYPDARDGNECSRYAAYNWIENHWTCGTFDRSTWVGAGIFLNPIGLGTDGYIYYHESGSSANGGALTASITSGDFDIQDGENILTIRSIVPDFEEQRGAVRIALETKLYPNGPRIQAGTYTATATTQRLNMRRLGRQARLRLESSTVPSSWRMGALRMDVTPTGAMR